MSEDSRLRRWVRTGGKGVSIARIKAVARRLHREGGARLLVGEESAFPIFSATCLAGDTLAFRTAMARLPMITLPG